MEGKKIRVLTAKISLDDHYRKHFSSECKIRKM
jgi:methylmalonyl-CoA mutase cobalamin-binding subunit